MRSSKVLKNVFLQTIRNWNPELNSLQKSYNRLGFTPKSLFLTFTPYNMSSILSQLEKLSQTRKTLNIVVASLDTGFQSSVSELWSDKDITVENSTPIDNSKDIDYGLDTKATLNVKFEDGIKSSFNISNGGKFYNDSYSSLMYFKQGNIISPNLSMLEIRLPVSKSSTPRLEPHDDLTYLEGKDPLLITGATGNLITQVNGQSPSNFLTNLIKESKFSDRVSDIYAKITNNVTKKFSFHKVVAGGGQWGGKSHLLVLEDWNSEPFESQILNLQFFISDSEKEAKFDLDPEGICYEKVNIDSIDIFKEGTSPTVLENCFILGTEDNITIGQTTYKTIPGYICFDVLA